MIEEDAEGEGLFMLTSESQARLNDPGLLSVRERHFERLDALFTGEAQDAPFYLWGVLGQSEADPYGEPDRWLDACLDALARSADAAMDPLVFRPLVLEYGPYGVRFVDRILGARVYPSGDTWWGDGLTTAIGDLAYPELTTNETWRRAVDMTQAFLARDVSVPLFGLPTIASALNVAVNLYGEAFLTALLVEPEAARHDLEVINGLLCDLHRWYLDAVPLAQLQPVIAFARTQPPGFGQLCGCTTHLLSAEQYREFLAPLDDALLSVYPNGGMIHLCGAHAQHIPTWREMTSLRSVQLNDRASEDLQVYFRDLRDDQVIYLNPTETMTMERALDITGGQRLVIVADGREAGK